MTDPAKELADLCSKLQDDTDQRGEDFLAAKFNVPAWSVEFHQIVFCIAQRIADLQTIAATLDIDDDLRADFSDHLKDVSLAFALGSMRNSWRANAGGGGHYVRRENVQAIKMMSPQVREVCGYPKLSEAEIAALLQDLNQLRRLLEENEIVEHDFIRRALLDGVINFQFRLQRLDWLGWGYTAGSLREVLGAYFALESGFLNPAATNPQAGLILKRVREFCAKTYALMRNAKDIAETGEFMLAMYGALAIYSGNGPSVAGLLPGQS